MPMSCEKCSREVNKGKLWKLWKQGRLKILPKNNNMNQELKRIILRWIRVFVAGGISALIAQITDLSLPVLWVPIVTALLVALDKYIRDLGGYWEALRHIG